MPKLSKISKKSKNSNQKFQKSTSFVICGFGILKIGPKIPVNFDIFCLQPTKIGQILTRIFGFIFGFSKQAFFWTFLPKQKKTGISDFYFRKNQWIFLKIHRTSKILSERIAPVMFPGHSVATLLFINSIKNLSWFFENSTYSFLLRYLKFAHQKWDLNIYFIV